MSCGYPIFGYTVDKNHYIIPDPVEGPIIQEIYERYANMESSGSIGKDLWLRNALFTKSNKMLSHQTYVCSILKDKRYAKIDPNSIYPALISKELFYKVYPLQGYIYTEDGYLLSPSITNNRYLKNDGASLVPLSLNMNGAHGLTMRLMNQYLNSGVLEIDRQKQREELNDTLSKNKVKLAEMDNKILALQKENDRINARIIKGRLAESKGDEMIDANIDAMHAFEDLRQTLRYDNSVIKNKLAYLANPMLNQNEVVRATNEEDLKVLVNKYLRKIIAVKVGHSRYRMTYIFNDGTQKVGIFYSHSSGIIFYDENGVECDRYKIVRNMHRET